MFQVTLLFSKIIHICFPYFPEPNKFIFPLTTIKSLIFYSYFLLVLEHLHFHVLYIQAHACVYQPPCMPTSVALVSCSPFRMLCNNSIKQCFIACGSWLPVGSIGVSQRVTTGSEESNVFLVTNFMKFTFTKFLFGVCHTRFFFFF